jgi:hypothetical protein
MVDENEFVNASDHFWRNGDFIAYALHQCSVEQNAACQNLDSIQEASDRGDISKLGQVVGAMTKAATTVGSIVSLPAKAIGSMTKKQGIKISGLDYFLQDGKLNCSQDPERRERLVRTLVHAKGVGIRRVIWTVARGIVRKSVCDAQCPSGVDSLLGKLGQRIHTKDITQPVAEKLADLLCAISREEKDVKRILQLAMEILDYLI